LWKGSAFSLPETTNWRAWTNRNYLNKNILFYATTAESLTQEHIDRKNRELAYKDLNRI